MGLTLTGYEIIFCRINGAVASTGECQMMKADKWRRRKEKKRTERKEHEQECEMTLNPCPNTVLM